MPWQETARGDTTAITPCEPKGRRPEKYCPIMWAPEWTNKQTNKKREREREREREGGGGDWRPEKVKEIVMGLLLITIHNYFY